MLTALSSSWVYCLLPLIPLVQSDATSKDVDVPCVARASLAYTLAGIVGGGIAPLVFASLFKAHQSTLAVAAYVGFALLITLGVLQLARRRERG